MLRLATTNRTTSSALHRSCTLASSVHSRRPKDSSTGTTSRTTPHRTFSVRFPRQSSGTPREKVREGVLEIISDVTGKALQGTTKDEGDIGLKTELGMDKVDSLNVIDDLEEKFEVKLTEDDIEKLETVKDLIDSVEDRKD